MLRACQMFGNFIKIAQDAFERLANAIHFRSRLLDEGPLFGGNISIRRVAMLWML